jgi:lipopolysaccharide transport system ATP-binding protein
MRDSIIVFDHVYKSYPLYHHITGGLKNLLFHLPSAVSAIRNSRYEALKDITFEIKRGGSLGIIGKNGAGKSTILSLIAGVLRPTEGQVVIKGRVSSLLELGAGFHPELTGRENIILNGIILGSTKSKVIKKIDEIIEFSEIEEFIDQPIRVYSSGMLARLGFSVMAHLDPDILLIDEILAVGDREFQKKCIDKMVTFKKSGVTIVLVSHAVRDILTTCDLTLWIDNHRVRMFEKSEEVTRHYVETLT